MELWLRKDREEIDLGLDRPRQVWRALGARPPGRRVVIVGGTNGKGSCVEAIRRLGVAQGLRVGATFSPHLCSYSERLLLPQGPVPPQLLLQAAERVEQARGEVPLTWFEFLVLAILEVMADAELDLAVLEVGLGGRGDIINMVEPNLAAITGVALDHCQYLGGDVESIGAEKAWIYRQGVPALFGDPQLPDSVRAHIEAIGAQPWLCGRDYQLEQLPQGLHLRAPALGLDCRLPPPLLPARSVALGLVAARLLWPQLDLEQAVQALHRAQLPGRFQYLPPAPPRPAALLDVAHNPEAMQYLASRLRRVQGGVTAVFGAMADKDHAGMVQPLRGLVQSWHLCRPSAGTRPAPTGQLRDALLQAGGLGGQGGQGSAIREHGSVAAALDAASAQARENGSTLLVCGSFYVVGEALEQLGLQSLPTEGSAPPLLRAEVA